MRLILTFHSFDDPQLSEIVFLREGQEELIAVRGKSSFRGDPTGRFQWTTAVKAFALLGLGSRLALVRAPEQQYSLVGGESSAASSLDYAINKPTQWILDVFGEDHSGKPFASRIFQRLNSERKRPGSVKVALSTSLLSPNQLKIFVGETEIESEKQLSELLENVSVQIEKNSALGNHTDLAHGVFTQRDSSPEEFNHNVKSSRWFQQSVRDDLKLSLQDTSLLEKLGIHESVEALTDLLHPTEFAHIERLREEIELSLTSQSVKFRPLRRSDMVAGDIPNTLAMCSPFATGAISLFTYMRDNLDLPIEIDWNFPGTSSIVEHVEPNNESHNAFVLSWGAALQLRSTGRLKNYRACALLPRTRFSLLFPRADPTVKVDKIFLALGKLGYPEQYFRYISKELALTNNYSLHDATLSECIIHLRRGDGGAVLASPLSRIMEVVEGCKIPGAVQPLPKVGDNILFLSDQMQDSSIKVFVHAITQSWFRLLQDSKEQERIVHHLIVNTPYSDLIKQLGGLFQD